MLSMDKPKLNTGLRGCVLLIGLCMTTIPTSTAFAQTADEDVIIVANGNILTMNANQQTASAMAVKEGRLLQSVTWKQ